jgi:hypothetical protein
MKYHEFVFLLLLKIIYFSHISLVLSVKLDENPNELYSYLKTKVDSLTNTPLFEFGKLFNIIYESRTKSNLHIVFNS